MIPSATSQEVGSLVPQTTVHQQPVLNAMQTRALTCLGRPYDVETRVYGRHVFSPFSPQDIHVTEVEDEQCEVVAARVQDAMRTVGSKWGISLEGWGVGLSVGHEATTTDATTQQETVCVAMRVKRAVCELMGDFPALPNTTPPCRLVRKVRVLTGYVVQLRIETDETLRENQQGGGAKVGIPVKGVVLGGFLQRIQESAAHLSITRIALNTLGFGGYTPPKFAVSGGKNLEEALALLDQHFQNNLSGICAHQIEPILESLSLSTHRPPAALPTPPLTWSPPVPLAQEEDMGELCSRVRGLLEREGNAETLNCALRGRVEKERVGLQELLEKIKELGVVFRRILTIPRYDNSILILGNSGTGKSALVSFLLGGEMKINEEGYLINEIAGPEWPEIGHGGSCTQGVHSYESYFLCIDTAGFHDTNGRVSDVVNAAAIGALAKRLSSCQLVFMIWGNYLDDRRGRELFECIQKLLGFLPREAPEDLWRSVRLVFAEKRGVTRSRENILKNVKTFIVRLEKEVSDEYEKHKPKTSLSSVVTVPWKLVQSGLRKVFQQERETQEEVQLKEFLSWLEEARTSHPSIVTKIEEKMSVIEVLKKVEEEIIQVVSVDMTDLQNRGSIVDFFRKNRGVLSSTSLVMDTIVPEWTRQFDRALGDTISYFNRLFVSGRNAQREMQSLRERIQNDEGERTITETALRASEIPSDNAQAIRRLEIRLGELETQRGVLDQELQRLERALQDNMINPLEHTALPPRRPVGGIPSRGWWEGDVGSETLISLSANVARMVGSEVKKMGTTCKLECDEGIPLVDVRQAPPTKREDPIVKRWRGNNAWEGRYFLEGRTRLREGKYSVWYKPCWYGADESGISITPLVEKQHHPDIRAERTRLEAELGPRPGRADLNAVGARVNMYRNEREQEDIRARIANMRTRQNTFEQMQQRLRDLGGTIDQNRGLFETRKKEMEAVLGELLCYRSLCQTFADVTNGLCLKGVAFEKFLRDFKAFDNNISLGKEEPF